MTAAAFACIYLWQDWQADRTLNAVNQVVKSADLDALLDASSREFDENVAQAMRGIHLSQGEAGREIWQLEAEFGTYREESGQVDLQKPSIRYAMGEGNASDPDYVQADSDRGRVENDNTLMTMEGNFFSSWQDQTLQGPVATFRNDTRVMELPRGGSFTGRDLEGEANVLRWNLGTNIMEGEGGVRLVWTPPPSPAPSQADGDHRPDPAGVQDTHSNPDGEPR